MENKSTSETNQTLDDSSPVIPDRTWTELDDLGSTEHIQIDNDTSNGIVDEPCAYIMCS